MMNIIFRVDSSTIIGHGHVMRCLTLAHELTVAFKKLTTKKSACNAKLNISFLCRVQPGNINQRIIDANFTLIELAETTQAINSEDTSTWLATSIAHDAEECINQLKLLTTVDLLIIDHYAIDHQWQRLTQSYYQALFIIDDLANRQHICDYLLDQTYKRETSDYQSRVPNQCQLLLGQDYILLRDEFLLLKEQAKVRRENFIGSIRSIKNSTPPENDKKLTEVNILISIGGSDPENLSQTALFAVKKLAEHSLANLIKVAANVVISKQSKHLDSLREFCHNNTWATLIIDSKNMAKLMLSADLAVGACGGTAWERCALGLPCLTSTNANNQVLIANNLSKAGAIKSLGWHKSITENNIIIGLEELIYNVEIYQSMVDACLNVCDGKGAKRVANTLLNKKSIHNPSLDITAHDVIFCPATNSDCELTFQWQSNKEIRKYFINPKTPSWQEHKHWYHACLADPNRELYIIVDEFEDKIGLLRLDKIITNKISANAYEISIIIEPKHQGKGLCFSTLKKLVSFKKNAVYLANINKKNTASQRAFTKAGFIINLHSKYQLTVNNYHEVQM